MLCQDVMTTDPKCCAPSDTAQRVASMMKIQNVGSVPVCSGKDNKRLVGIVTDRDLCVGILAEGRDASTPIESCMARDPVTCRADEDLDSAVRRMEANQVRRIPVLDSNGSLVGIIAQADIATRAHNAEKTAEVVSEISRP